MSRCDQCRYWNPKTDMSSVEEGFGRCAKVGDDPISSSERRKLRVYVTEEPCVSNYLITRMDFGCILFSSVFP